MGRGVFIVEENAVPDLHEESKPIAVGTTDPVGPKKVGR
jgi:hypothetical protein